jgi:hypothetical protein
MFPTFVQLLLKSIKFISYITTTGCRLLQQHMGKHTIHLCNMARIMNNAIKIIGSFQSNIKLIFSFVNKKVKIVATKDCVFQSSQFTHIIPSS